MTHAQQSTNIRWYCQMNKASNKPNQSSYALPKCNSHDPCTATHQYKMVLSDEQSSSMERASNKPNQSYCAFPKCIDLTLGRAPNTEIGVHQPSVCSSYNLPRDSMMVLKDVIGDIHKTHHEQLHALISRPSLSLCLCE